MCLRVNQRHQSTSDYQQILQKAGMSCSAVKGAPEALLLEKPVPVHSLPGFEAGDVSVQDAAAQLAGFILRQHVGEGVRFLDACAAPGGKTAHAAEAGYYSSITALDHDADRLSRVESTLERLQLKEYVEIEHADATNIEQWWDGKPYGAILLDAPCSGTGVIRRHPDIKLLRWESDIEPLMTTQGNLLDALWQTLDDKGVLLYATCSVLKDENEHQVKAFLERTSNAVLLEEHLQIFPGEKNMDGFFYAAIGRKAL